MLILSIDVAATKYWLLAQWLFHSLPTLTQILSGMMFYWLPTEQREKPFYFFNIDTIKNSVSVRTNFHAQST